MKRYTFLGIIAVLLGIAVPAHAGSYVGEVSNGLKSTPVYIAANTEGTDGDTAGTLVQQLNSNDNIALVMLPASASDQFGSGLGPFVKQVSAAIGSKRIIGVVMGSQAVGYAPAMPTGVAADLMHRAVSVSTNNIEVLTTFVRNVHEWQQQHPEAKTTSKPKSAASSSHFLGVLMLIVGGIVVFVLIIAVAEHVQKSRTGEARKHFDGPSGISDQLNRIARLRDQVADASFQKVLFQCCTDTERYFKKYSSDVELDALTFGTHLDSIINVVAKYLEVQEFPRDFNDPETIMQGAKHSVSGFADYVIKSIRNGNDSRLISYRVDTNILDAKRYS